MIGLIIFFSLFGYSVGSIPTGYWLAWFLRKKDLTLYGSGNIGATNSARVLGGFRYFFLVCFVDAFKAYFTLFLTDSFFSKYQLEGATGKNILLVIACCLILGNAHSVFLRFKGGKGVATSIGVVLYLLSFSLFFIAFLAWGLIISHTKQMFLANVGATVIFVVFYTLLFYQPGDFLFYFLLFILYWIISRHQENLKNYFKFLR
jgi:acyl phosphate:glycerol-3-phosphate acyltransferase